jgi:hypothetical protein
MGRTNRPSADIAASAYQYRADRKPDENAPESWLAVMRFARQSLNHRAETTAPAVKQVLSALLGEEIRPVQQMELIWPADAKRRPAPEADNSGCHLRIVRMFAGGRMPPLGAHVPYSSTCSAIVFAACSI